MKFYLSLLTSILLVILASSCSNTKYLAEGKTLYNGPVVELKDTLVAGDSKKSLQKELAGYVRPKENSQFLGLKVKLYLWNLAGTPKKKKGGLRNFIRNKVGEPPVFGDDVKLEVNTDVLINQLNNRGYFNAIGSGLKTTKGKRTKAHFEIYTGHRYKYRNVDYTASDTQQLSLRLQELGDSSVIKVGEYYDLELVKAERQRINDKLGDMGYYFFNESYILEVADTSVGTHEIDAHVRLKKNEMPYAAFYPFSINKVTIIPNYKFETQEYNVDEELDLKDAKRKFRDLPDTMVYENFTVIDPKHTMREVVFKQAMQFEPGDIYSQREQNLALRRLVGMGNFKFVKNEFTAVQDESTVSDGLFNIAYNTLLQRGFAVGSKPLLDVTYYLTQYPKKRLNAELGAYTLNDSRAGSRLNLGWSNKNLLRGSELFSVKGTVGFEVQYGGQVRRPNTYNFGLETDLAIPRFIVPFFKIRPSTYFVPKTIISLKGDYYLRTGLYRISTVTGSFGYNWKESPTKEHRFFPINITYVKTDTLNKGMKPDVNLNNILFNGLIIGPTYDYTFNTQAGIYRKNDFYFNGQADLSANILGLVQGTSLEKEPKKIFNTPYAQYLKFQTDFRYYHNFSKDRSIASRIFAGFGYPYGNSQSLPNVKQFFSGGSSSLRGFNSRLVGPGTFNEKYLTGDNTYIELLGDIKLEANVEFRSKLYSIINGAVFVDAGNIWLYRDNPDFPGGKFSKDFINEVAVDAGIGLRFDVKILLIRLDLGMPIRKPWLPEGNRWVLDQVDFGNSTWRKDNLVLSIAIGYPF